MVNLETVKKCYAEKKNLDKELIEQFKLIGKVLGSIYTYKDFEYCIPNDMIDIDDVQDFEDGILDIFYITTDIEISVFQLNEELLRMNEEELVALKENA